MNTTRKTKLFLYAFAIATTLVSCSKENAVTNNPTSSEQTVNDSTLLGNWIIEKSVVQYPNAIPRQVDIDGDCPNKAYFELKTEGTFEEGSVDSKTCEFTKTSGQWKKTNNSLEITTDKEGKSTYNIISSTENQLVLRMTEFGANVPTGTYIDLTFSKKQ